MTDKRLRNLFVKNYSTEKERVFARVAKLTEEVGELSGEVLASMGSQRKEKLKDYNRSNLSDEFADVIITTLLLAKIMEVDIEDALKSKIEKINNRFSKE